MKSTNSTAAREYLRATVRRCYGLGWSFLPLQGKRPFQPGWQTAPRPSLGEVLTWVSRGYNIGLRTGTASGVVVIDADSGSNVSSLDLPKTATAATGGGGVHFFFKHTGPLGNSSGRLGPRIDVKADAGQVVLAGSVHPQTRKMYEWLPNLAPWEVPLAELPEHILRRLNQPDAEPPPPEPRSAPMGGDQRLARYVEAAIKKETRQVAAAAVGSRNDTLNRASYALGQLVGAGYVDRGTAEVELLQAALAAGLPRSEATATIRSGLDAGEKEPRQIDLRAGGPRSGPQNGQAKAGPAGQAGGAGEPSKPTRQYRYQPFPVHALPEPVQSFVAAAAQSVGCDVSLFGLTMLGVLARGVGNRRVIALKRDWKEPAVVWGALIVPSGCHKTPALNLATRLLQSRQAAAQQRYEIEEVRYHQERNEYEKQLAQWKKSKSPAPPPEPPTVPHCLKYTVGDLTTERLAEILANQSDGVLAVRDELTSWLHGLGEYKRGSRSSDTGHWLSAWSAMPWSVDRKTGKKSVFIPRAAVSLIGAVPPAVFIGAMRGEHQHDGLLARFLLTAPPMTPVVWSEAEVPIALWQDMEQLLDGLLALPGDIGHGDQPEPRPMWLDDEGRRLWIEAYNAHRRQMLTYNDTLRAAAAKAEAYRARFALLFACARIAWTGRDDGLVHRDELQAAITLADWFLNEAGRVYELFDSVVTEGVPELVPWIAEHCPGGCSIRVLYSAGPRQFRNSPDAAEEALNGLAADGYGQWVTTPPASGGGPAKRVFKLAEEWLAAFRPDAEEEAPTAGPDVEAAADCGAVGPEPEAAEVQPDVEPQAEDWGTVEPQPEEEAGWDAQGAQQTAEEPQPVEDPQPVEEPPWGDVDAINTELCEAAEADGVAYWEDTWPTEEADDARS